mgnify:FL=1
MEQYQKDFKAFLANFKATPVSGVEAGEFAIKLADYYSDQNLRTIEELRKFNMVKKVCSEQMDSNDKPISIAKAELLADATPEAHSFEIARAHLGNLDQMISAVKTLQKGLVNEYNRVQ